MKPIDTGASSYELYSGQHEKHWRQRSRLAAPVTALAEQDPRRRYGRWTLNRQRPQRRPKQVKARRYAQSLEGQARPGIEPGPAWQVLRG